MNQKGPRILFVGWDAMDADMAFAWADEGHMPTLAKLRSRALTGELVSPDGFFVGALWSSFATSTGPGTHGRYSWKQFDPATYTHVDAPEGDGDAEPFWLALDRAGLRCAVVDVPHATVYPEFGGLFVEDWLVHDGLTTGIRTQPTDLAARLLTRFGSDPMTGCCNHFPRSTGDDYRALADALIERAGKKSAFLQEVLAQDEWDVVAACFGEAHCVGHHAWHLHEPTHPDHDPALVEVAGNPIRDVYAALDRELATVLEHTGPETTVLLAMSHGLCQHFDADHLIDEVVNRIQRAIPMGRRRTLGERLSMLRGTHYRPKRGWSGLIQRWPEYAFRKAFRDYNNEACAAIRVNLVGRDRLGIIRPGAELDAFLDALADALLACRNGETKDPVFTRVFRTDDVTSGPRRDTLPDLLCEWARTGPIESIESPLIGRVEGKHYTNRTGDHRNYGQVLAVGPGIVPGRLEGRTPIEDLAPSICARLGVALEGVQGRPVARLVGDGAHAPTA